MQKHCVFITPHIGAVFKKPTGPVSRVLLKAVIYLDGGLLPPLKPSFGTRRTSV